jgi:hypothetical protein
VTLTTTVIGRCSRAVFSSRTTRSGVEALGEPVVDWRKQVVRLRAPTSIAPQPGEAGRGPELKRFAC